MKKIFFIVMLLIGAITYIQAQEEEEETTYFTSFPVNYTGQKPVITDFVTAILSQSNGEGVFVEIADNWKKYQKGETLPKGKSFTVDTKNGYIRYDAIYSKEESVYVEFCFWNSTDGKHKIVASNFVLLLNGKPTDTELTGQSFYQYDNATKKMIYTYAYDLGVQPEYPNGAQCSLPRVGKSIEYVYDTPSGKMTQRFTWNGSKFVAEKVTK